MLLPEYWHKGYGSELVKLLVNILEENYRDAKIIAITNPDNIC